MTVVRAMERGLLWSPLHRLVAGVVGIGAAAFLALLWLTGRWGVAPAMWSAASPVGQALLVGLLVLLACAAEVGYVRVRHGDSTEDLTFFEAVLIAGVLLVPPIVTFAISLGGLGLACLVMRRPLLKTLFNLGSYSAATATFVAVTMLLARGQERFSIFSLLALLLGTAVFAAVNLLALTRVLAVTEDVNPRDVLAAEWRLSAFMTVSQVGLGTVTVAVALTAPVLLPFMALPVLAIGYAYQAVARHAAEVERGRSLVALGSVVAASGDSEDFLPTVAGVLHRLFGCDALLLAAADGLVLEHDSQRVERRGENSRDSRLRRRCAESLEPHVLTGAELPADWRYGLAAALDLGSAGRGLVVLGWSVERANVGSRPWPRRRTPVAPTDPALLGAVAAAVGTSVRSRQHLTDLVEESSKLKSVVEHSSDGIVVLDRQGDLLVWSPAMERMTGLSRDQVARSAAREGDAVTALLSGLAVRSGAPVDADELDRRLDPTQQRTEVEVTLGADEDSAQELRVSVARTLDRTGTWRLAILTVHDVTRERRLERLKSDFIATVSHELRTPITPIKGYARLLATKGDDIDPERRLKALRLIEDRADHLARLVEDLLLTSQVSTSRTAKFVVESTRLDLGELVDRAAESFPQLAGRLEVRRAPGPLHVDGDAVRVVQCLSNLLSNAEKYSPAGSPIAVDVSLIGPGEPSCRVSVTDRGRGIPPDELDNVFRRFYRVEDALTMRTGGSGLGLFIARELARAMGGDITATSTLGEGSCFSLQLPLATADSPGRTGDPSADLSVAS